ncbi:MAG: UDP-glucose 4-epimerase GalE [Nitrospiraceae bacterium]|nr:UDP-glucose 4-epimerase GalE [Nitrospiraceae bacterium]
MDTVLVTGGAGYIGSHVVKNLAAEGYRVVVFDNLSTGFRDSVLAGDLVVGDLADSAALDELLRTFRPAAVMHFAANIEVGESVRDPLKYYRNNAANTVNLLAALAREGVRKCIFSSTAAVYGIPDTIPIRESEPIRPINPYGQAKAFVEKVLEDCSRSGDIDYVSLRYFNASGADPQGRIGERHTPESHLIPLTLKAARGARRNITVFGSDYATPDGTCVRDYIHVEDLSSAHLLALEHLLQGGESGAFNCGYGHGYSVSEVIETAKRVTGVEIPVELSGRRPGDPPVLVADSTGLQQALHWKPRHDDLEFIVRTAWEWERKQS